MPCKDCYNNCDPLVTDRCVKYTGPEIEVLGICTGDNLYEIEDIILNKLIALANGTGITLDVTLDCLLTQTLVGVDKTLPNLIQALLDATCSFDGRIKTVENTVNAPYLFDILCLENDPSTRDEVIQSIINLVCDINARLTIIENTYVKQADLCTQVQACLASSATPQFNSRMVPYTYIPYAGPLSNFDNTGKGLIASGFDKIYLANGLNGTQDWRGRSPIGAIQNVPGTTLDSAVDPAITTNANYNYFVGTKYGSTNTVLTNLQSAPHTHNIIDNGHTHFTISSLSSSNRGYSQLAPFSRSTGDNNGNEAYTMCVVAGTADVGLSSPSISGISIQSSGGGQPHTNLHPSIGCLYIVYLP